MMRGPFVLLLALAATCSAQSQIYDCSSLNGRTHIRTLYPNEPPNTQLFCGTATPGAECDSTYSASRPLLTISPPLPLLALHACATPDA